MRLVREVDETLALLDELETLALLDELDSPAVEEVDRLAVALQERILQINGTHAVLVRRLEGAISRRLLPVPAEDGQCGH